jgi:hypothetical protein
MSVKLAELIDPVSWGQASVKVSVHVPFICPDVNPANTGVINVFAPPPSEVR